VRYTKGYLGYTPRDGLAQSLVSSGILRYRGCPTKNAFENKVIDTYVWSSIDFVGEWSIALQRIFYSVRTVG
jgi:hypothetical protein